MNAVPLDSSRWTWPCEPRVVEHLGRECVTFDDPEGGFLLMLDDVELRDGVIELELAVSAERAFHGVVWRAADDENYEAFFVRPHQVGNPDSIQYTPVSNGISSWQLYHGEGFWASVPFPIDEWFAIRVAFRDMRGEVDVGETTTPTLAISELKRPSARGRVGVQVGGPGLHLARFAYGDETEVTFRGEAPPLSEAQPDGVVPVWSVSDAFREDDLDIGTLVERTWTELVAEPAGLADLARVNGIRDGRNCAFARASIHSDRRQDARFELGFSDHATVFLNGRALYRGDDTYRSRDYRFLGSIGWYDTVVLPLDEGDNDLVVAVAEDFGGWGIQGRFPVATGITLSQRS